jgi:hypothetical protein
MSRRFRSIAIAIVVVAAFAATGLAATPATAPKAKAARPHSLVGTLQKFDETGKMLTVQTGKGSETLTLESSARIHQGSKSLSPADLASHTGAKVKIRYSEVNGQKMAEDVRLASAAPAKVTKTAKK